MNRMMLVLPMLILSVSTAWSKDKVDKLPPYEDTYWIEHFSSIPDAEKQATEMAITAALEKKYGRTLDTRNYTEVKSVGGVQSTNFYNSGTSQINGKMISMVRCETRPELDGRMIKVWVKVEITAKARNEDVPITWRVQKYATDQAGTDKFVNNDPFFLYFHSPEEGYLAIYLEDENGQTYNLLPYGDESNAVHVNRKQKYLFFCDDRKFFESHKEYARPANFKLVQPLCLTSPQSEVRNRVYVLFSPEKFTCKTTGSEGNISVLSSSDFRDWMGQMNVKDGFMEEHQDIQIYPKNNYKQH